MLMRLDTAPTGPKSGQWRRLSNLRNGNFASLKCQGTRRLAAARSQNRASPIPDTLCSGERGRMIEPTSMATLPQTQMRKKGYRFFTCNPSSSAIRQFEPTTVEPHPSIHAARTYR